ncbi:hypothetical protein L596_009655 [Steinernema carpocapsae]|uniref:Hexosyltransferase n=1 Tax=Steinernema carpocapsae TaxID=34508 RepID=A0A4U5PGA1_STECR|nr:hypothetical protein L596_009655 [Steinernema carpocapsae]
MGDPRNVEISKKLEAENEDYGDLIITDLVDSYKNLTLKVYAGLDWFNRFCSEVQFFMKIDDDVALHVERLVHFVNTKFQRSPNQTVYCAFGDVVVIRNNSSKWYVPPELYAPSTYPNFCIGATYMISAEAAKVIGEKTPEHPFLYIDDVFYTGIVAEAAGIPRVNEAQIFFNWDAIKDVTCDEGGVPYLATMYEFKTPEALFKAYYTLQGIKCGPWWRALLG